MKKRNKIIIRLVSTLAVMLCVTGVTHIQAKNVYAKKTITMTTKSIPSEKSILIITNIRSIQ